MTNEQLDYLLDKIDVFIENEIKLNKGVISEKRIHNKKYSKQFNTNSNSKE